MYQKFSKMSTALLSMGLFSMLITASCKDKTIVSNPPEPTTAYEGIYKRTTNFGSEAGEQIIDSQFVEWKFVESKFYCRAINTEQANPIVCDSYGDYELTNSGKLLIKNVTAISQPCHDEEFPEGEFSLRMNFCPGNPDSLIMDRLTPEDIFISIKLGVVRPN